MTAAPSRVRPAIRGDLPEVVDLLVACDVAQIGEPDTTSDDIETHWNAEVADLTTDTWVAEGAGGALIGYAYAGDQHRTGEIEGDLWVHPEADDPGLAGRLLGLVERRARGLAARYGESAALEIYCLTTDRPKRELLRQQGFAPRRTVYRLRIDLPDGQAAAPPPPGIEVRPFREGADEQVMHRTMAEAFEDHFRQSDEPFADWQARLIDHPSFDPALWFLAWDGGEPAGALIAYDYGDAGWIKGLGVRRPYRRRGLGTALLTAAFAELGRRGQRRVELGVDADGETRPLSLYEAAGMRIVRAYELLEKPLRA